MEYKQKHPEFPLDSAWSDPIKIHYFIGEVSDLAFGDETIERGFSMEEVVNRLKLYSELSIGYD
tara:strand:+ start:3087 stop:3278 length:192 start_codon:yes stop_codon:yes gene_type:complete